VLPGSIEGAVNAGAKRYAWAVWGEQLAPNSGTRILAEYADQFYAGKPAAITRALGKGTVTYIGVESLTGDLETDLLDAVFKDAGVKTEHFADQFLVDWRDGFWVATNFSSHDQTAPVPKSAKLILGAKKLPPAGVAVWTE